MLLTGSLQSPVYCHSEVTLRVTFRRPDPTFGFKA